MTTVLAELSRGGGLLTVQGICPGPSGGAYVVATGLSGTVHAARLNSDGSINWAKDITVPTLSEDACAVASSSDRVAIAISDGFARSTVLMLDNSGTLVWESSFGDIEVFFTEGLLIGSDNSVYVTAWYDGPLGGSQYDGILLKLNPTTGAITWQVGLSETSTTSYDTHRFGGMRQLSGGDIVLALWGPGSTDNDHAHVQRVSSSDGSVVWTRKINWGGFDVTDESIAWIGTDGSDNIYCAGPGDWFSSPAQQPVVKLDSSGSLLWARNVQRPGGASALFSSSWGTLTADASGVQIVCSPTVNNIGHVSIDASGTVGAGNVPVSQYNTSSSSPVRGGETGSSTVLFASTYYDGADYSIYVVRSPAGAGDDAAYGSVTRTTSNYDLIAGTATVTTPGSWTRPSAPTIALISDYSASLGTGTLTSSVVVPAFTCAASSFGPTTQFGPDPFIRGYTRASAPSTTFGNIIISRSFPNVGLTPPSTTFGTAVAQRLQRATALGPTANFGTPAYEPDTTRAADTLGVVLAGIGVPFATLGIAPQPPGYASSVEPATTFGTPVAQQGISLAATGTLVTQFGTASARYTLAASGLEPGAQFGTAKVTMSRAASGFKATQIGTPAVGLYGLPAGFMRTQFGAPAVRAPITCEATGFLVTNIGSPSGGAWNLRTRSAYFRTRFGTPQAERTAP